MLPTMKQKSSHCDYIYIYHSAIPQWHKDKDKHHAFPYLSRYKFYNPWWRHQMETLLALLALCAENWPITGEFPSQRPVTGTFDVSFDPPLNKRLSKQSWGWWFETPTLPLWHHCNYSQLCHSFHVPFMPCGFHVRMPFFFASLAHTFNTLKTRQNGHHFTDDIFTSIF